MHDVVFPSGLFGRQNFSPEHECLLVEETCSALPCSMGRTCLRCLRCLRSWNGVDRIVRRDSSYSSLACKLVSLRVLVRLQGGVVQDWALEGDAADRIGEIAGSAMAISPPPAAAKHRNP